LSFSSDAPAPSRLSPLPLHDALPICGFLSDPSTVKHCALPRISRCGSGTARASLLLGPSSLRQRVDGANVTRVTGVRMFEILPRSEEHTSELQSRENLVCRLLLEKKK